MQILIILSSNSPEIKWNAVRFGNFMLNAGEEVTIFLNGPGVDLYDGDSEQFPISEEAKLFALSEGMLAAWGKCMLIHGVDESEYVKQSNMKTLYEQVKLADKIISY